MSDYAMPVIEKPPKAGAKEVVLIASGDLRVTANQSCWAAQAELEADFTKAVEAAGYTVRRAHPYKEDVGHGLIGSQKEGIAVFKSIDPKAKLVVAEAMWQYSHHVMAGLLSHEGDILIAANWSGTWPGLVGAVNLAASLTKAGREYSFLWSEDFETDEKFRKNLRKWLKTGKVKHPTPHVTSLSKVKVPAAEKKLGKALAEELKVNKAIMGVFDEGCMGMLNAIIPDSLLNPTGVYKERLSQSALYYAATQVSDDEARAVYKWYLDKGVKFELGPNEETDFTEAQVLMQCKTYVAAVRIADEFGCDVIGIQYQQGLKDLLPASDLVEGTLNDSVRPPVMSADGSRELYAGEPLPHFNEVDECCGFDLLLTNRVQKAMGQPVESTLHDVRWGDRDASGTTDEYVWVFEISGSVPPAHLIDYWAGVTSVRQDPMFFRLGGGTIKGISKPGEIVWSRIYIEQGKLWMDLGRAKVIELPLEETQRRWDSTTPQWPIMHAVLHGVTRDQFMAKHKSNHVNVVYGTDAAAADAAMFARAAMAEALGIKVNLCGTDAAGKKWGKK
ncbi:MAG: fucose isomerase [Planctomycetota bacterium]|jgi:hypothetical protein